MSGPDSQNVAARDFGTGATYTFSTATFNTAAGDFAGHDAASSGNGGVYSVNAGTPTISSDGAYGGGAGQGNYLSITDSTSITITFEQPVNYFGFQWTAGNAGNQVTLYDTNNQSLGTFDTATITGMLPNSPGSVITALNGTIYNTQSYYGLPGDRGVTPDEPFAYVHFVNEGALAISRIVLTHSGGGGFESDNHSVFAGKVVPDPSSPLVLVGTVPEPSTAALALLGAAAILRRRR